VGLGGRSSTCCEVGRREVSGQSDGEGLRRRGAARPMAGKTKKKNKTNRGSATHGRKKKKKKKNRGSTRPMAGESQRRDGKTQRRDPAR
jgi:hypothetical protein